MVLVSGWHGVTSREQRKGKGGLGRARDPQVWRGFPLGTRPRIQLLSACLSSPAGLLQETEIPLSRTCFQPLVSLGLLQRTSSLSSPPACLWLLVA